IPATETAPNSVLGEVYGSRFARPHRGSVVGLRSERFALEIRQTHDECRAFAGCALRTNFASVALRNLAADGQADAGAFVLSFAMQALEHREDALGVFLIEA